MNDFTNEELVSVLAGLEIYRRDYFIEKTMDRVDQFGEFDVINLVNDADYQSILTAQEKITEMMKENNGNV